MSKAKEPELPAAIDIPAVPEPAAEEGAPREATEAITPGAERAEPGPEPDE